MSRRRPQYDHRHDVARAAALAAMQDGEPCPFCSRPMTREMPLDFDHAIPVVNGGAAGPRRLAHRKCNRAAGARISHARRRRPTPIPAQPAVRSRDW